jgi:hypothetical protein
MSQVESMSEPVTPAELLSISDAQPAILIDVVNQAAHEEKQTAPVNVCNAVSGWCKNVCKEGQTVCDECTKMMDSYP